MFLFKKKKGQSTLEFVTISAVMVLVFIGMVIVIQERVSDAQESRLHQTAESFGKLLSAEIRMAESTEGDYSREFFLPYQLQGFEYDIKMYNKTEIVVTVGDFTHILFLDMNVSGNISKGYNRIRSKKNNITIYPLEQIEAEMCEGPDDDACGTIDCSGWYNQSGIEAANETETCYNKQDITTNRCEGVDNCKDSNSSDCDETTNDIDVLYSCGTCQYISASDCTGTTLGRCSNYSAGTSCGVNMECDGLTGCNPVSVPSTYNVSYWALEGNAIDSWGSNDGTLYGSPMFGAGRCSQGINFDGVDDYISIPQTTFTDYTVLFWLYYETPPPSSERELIHRGYVSGTIYEPLIALQSDNTVRAKVSGGGEVGETGTGAVSPNNWHHVAYVVNTTDQELYIDGISTANASKTITPGNYYTLIGAYAAQNDGLADGEYFNGSIDEVKIYNKSLSQIEIQQIIQQDIINCPISEPSGQVSYWSLDGDTNDQWDGSDGINNGAIYGDPQYVTGQCGQALAFDAEGDYVEMNKYDIENKNLTVMAWVNRIGNCSDTGYCNLVYTSGYNDGWRLILNRLTPPLNTFRVGISKGGDATTRCVRYSSSFNMNLNTWYHVAGVWNSTELMIFVDGILRDSMPCDQPYIPSSDTELTMGRYEYGVGAFNGTLDEVKIFNRSFTQSEIAAEMICSTPSSEGFIVTDNSGTTVAVFSETGDIVLNGACSSGGCSPPADSLVFRSSGGSTLAYIDNTGNMCLQNDGCNDNDANCDSPGANSFVVQDQSNNIVSYINDAGELCLIGSIT